ncbi:MAG TPA: alginate lyase family protein, partial [Burkholderiaceae bacterium]|nr:alginate lyase family protein [Burkholderiaceae bacterium]
QRFKRRWLDSIYKHCHFIAAYQSRHSSANNHLFGELMGLFVAATTWPMWKEGARWKKDAFAELEIEALKQNTADGVNREQAIYYQHEIIDMMLICGLVGRANGIEFSQNYWNRIERLLEFIAAVMDVSGNVPMIGDADDALIVCWNQEPEWNLYRSLLATGAVLFKRDDFKAKGMRFDDKCQWLLGDAAKHAFDVMDATDDASSTRREFRDGGYFIMGRNLDDMREIRLVVDAAPLGYLSIAAHGHADALAFTLSVAGCTMLIDPGTYSYHTQKVWRDYFKGTSAHNTVRVDGFDQSESGGNFMWLRKAQAYCEQWSQADDRDVFVGCHDGYAALPDPVIHRRKIELIKNDEVIFVEDTLECQGEHEIELHWHFSEKCTIEIEERKVIVKQNNVRLEMTMPDAAWNPALHRGQVAPPLGWVAYHFDEKLPSPTIAWRGKIVGTAKKMTVFKIAIE